MNRNRCKETKAKVNRISTVTPNLNAEEYDILTYYLGEQPLFLI